MGNKPSISIRKWNKLLWMMCKRKYSTQMKKKKKKKPDYCARHVKWLGTVHQTIVRIYEVNRIEKQMTLNRFWHKITPYLSQLLFLSIICPEGLAKCSMKIICNRSTKSSNFVLNSKIIMT